MFVKLDYRFWKVIFILCALTLCAIVLISTQFFTSIAPGPLPKARFQKRNKTKAEIETDELLHILQSRIRRNSKEKMNLTKVLCTNKSSTDDGTIHTQEKTQCCHDASCPGHFSSSPRERLQQILSTRATIPASYLRALKAAAGRVKSHKYIFVTGASSNHYQEMQGLVHSVINFLFPLVKGEDYDFVLYDLGLTPLQRNLTEKNCRCTVLDFPFSHLPSFIKRLKCYVWKPLVVASLLEKTECLVWMDASIRWLKTTPLRKLFSRARERGYQSIPNVGSIAVRSTESMARFFGDHLCQYSPFSEMQTGIGFYYNDRFMREVIMKPWLSCAFNRSCMCVESTRNLIRCGGASKRIYGFCHRFEQSAIGMIFSKLYLENRPMLYLLRGAVSVLRHDRMNWFKSS